MKKAKYIVKYKCNLEEGVGGRCYYPTLPMFSTCEIVILSKYKNDKGILKHEIKHAEQYANNFFHSIKLYFSRTYRYKAELEAYTEQIKEYNYTNPSQTDWIIEALFSKYNLSISLRKITEDVITIFNSIIDSKKQG